MTKRFSLFPLLAALILLVSLSPAGAAETDQVAVSQEGVTYYYDAAGNRLTNATSLSGNAVVEMKKWAEQRKDASGNAIENEFMVTLQVRTTERIEELSSDTPDAAVTLVIDVSNSMDDCYHCGFEASHLNHGGIGYKCPNQNSYFEGNNTNSNTRCDNCNQRFRNHTQTNVAALHKYESRLSFAQEAALDFIDQFANETGAEEGDKRYVALITFGSHAAARTQYIDVTTTSGMLAMELAIKNITVANAGVSFGNNTTDSGGTNIEGGLMLADNMIAANTAGGRVLNGINYLYTILLTDGTPTFYVNGNNSSTSTILGTVGGSNVTTKEDVKDVGVEAAKILAHSPQSRLFSICFGTDSTGDDVWDSQPFSTWNDANPATNSRDTVGIWLQKFSSAAYDASNLDSGLFDSFESVITQIQLAAQAWHVDDQMGPHINYLGTNLVSTGSGVISNDVSFTGDTLKWNILGSQPNPRISSVTTQNGVTTGILGYTCQYFISLNNLDSAYTNKTAATNANTQALLTYATKNDNDEWKIVDDVPFPVPQVQGLTGSFTFTKLNEEGEPLAGISFTLRDMVNGADYSMTAVSDRNGKVTFTNIPSGHPYRLDEQTGPEYLDLGDILFDIAWGEAVPKSDNIQGSAANGYFIVNEYSEHALSGLTLKKVFAGDIPEDAHYVEFTLRGARNHNLDYVQTIRLNNRNNWQNTFANLEPGWYTLHEKTNFEGYDNTLNITYQVMENGQLVTKPLLDDDGNGSYDIQLNAMGQYTEYTATAVNTLKRHTGDVTIQKTFWEHDLTPETDNQMEGLTRLTADKYSHITVTVSATPQGASAPLKTITLNSANGFKATFDDLPAGVYTLQETVTGDIESHAFEHSLFLQNGQEVTNTLTINKNDNISLELQNHYRHYLGHIRVEKVVTGDLTNDSELLENKAFVVEVWSMDREVKVDTLYLTAEHNWADSTALLPVGNYHLVEKSQDASVDGFTWVEDETSLSGDITVSNRLDAGVVVIPAQEGAYVAQTVILTNVYEQQLGGLQVTKVFKDETGADLNAALYADVSVTVTAASAADPTVTGSVTLNAANGFSGVISDLPVGDYSLSEEVTGAIDGYTFTDSVFTPETVTVTDNATAAASALLTNTYTRDTGSIILEKHFDADSALSKEDFEADNLSVLVTITGVDDPAFQRKITLSKANEWKQTVSGLPAGKYRITEEAQMDGYALAATITGAQVADGVVTLEKDTEALVIITNLYDPHMGSLIIHKHLTGDTEKAPDEFIFTVTAADGTSQTVAVKKENDWKGTISLPIGQYTVAEQVENGTDFRVHTVMDPADGKVTIAEGKTVTVTCTNDYESLITTYIPVEKTVVQTGNVAPGNNTFAFQAQVNIPATNAGSVTWYYQNDPANAGGVLQGNQNANLFYIAVQDAATIKGWIVITGYPTDLEQVTITLKETSEYATAEDAANADWILDDTVFEGAEWSVSFDPQCQPVIRRSDADEDAAAAAFTNTFTGMEEVIIPGTDDGSRLYLWMTLTVLSLCSIVILVIRKRKEA